MRSDKIRQIIGRANRTGKTTGAAGQPTVVKVTYAKKTTGRTVTRSVRPYEVRGGVLWGTDRIHGTTRIHKFLTSRVRTMTVPNPSRTFRPVWDVQTPGLRPKE